MEVGTRISRGDMRVKWDGTDWCQQDAQLNLSAQPGLCPQAVLPDTELQ